MTLNVSVDRRDFLKGAAGLVIGFYLPGRGELRADSAVPPGKLNAFVHIAPDETVTIMVDKAEMGQGQMTSIPMLLAEELECEWSRIRTEFAPVDKAYGSFQGTVGSSGLRSSWMPVRKAGASARDMLIEAAAQRWNVDKAQCHAGNGAVVNSATGARLTYGVLASDAAKLPVPQNVTLKDRKDFRLIGTSPKRLDTPAKVDGSAQFGIDVRVPGMQYAVVARCPVFGGKVSGFDASKAKSIPGVKNVVEISRGVAVIANNTWSALEGRKALQVRWDEGPVASVNSAGISKTFAARTKQPGAVARKTGDAPSALQSASKKVEAVYEVPFLAHACMEPLNCVADVRSGSCEVWASAQIQSAVMGTTAKITGLSPKDIQVHTTFLGGGFGRRGSTDFVAEAVEISKAIGAPVKVTWSREDDIQQGPYRPASYARFAGGLDAEGWPVAWTTNVACGSIQGRKEGVDRTSVEGIEDLLYDIPNFQVDYQLTGSGIPVSYWRAVGYTQNTFFSESFVDELAAAGGKDPVELRRHMLAKSPRLLAVLEMVAAKSNWGQPLPEGRARGVAVVNNIGSFTAQVAEVSVDQGKVRVHRVVCAVDCGPVVNPALVEQQIQGGIVYGLSAALKGGITIDHGRAQQSNFNDYDVLRIDEMPSVEVHIIRTDNSPGGIGEAAVPPIAPAVCNAIFAATGKRIRRLPVRAADLIA
ncbi:MAG TPA: xanthine dehydrogenase family protein molybdopterin-binding subunit [Bryobacteraceae bacterium]|jgi:isoquinoline 1-oxidoreductase beta subunit|nr:xanthine dehydrogenase family protein molybdopterin-binding subunit [Bryobacteraceae bacterium]